MTRRSIITWLILFSIIAFAARVGLCIYGKAWRNPNAMEHRSVALSLVNGTGFSFGDWGYYGPSSVQSPPFPFLLATMYKIFGETTPADGSLHGANRAYFAIMVLDAFAGAALVWLTFGMARTIGASTWAALIGAALVAIWPSQVYAARTVQAIVLITCGLSGGIILFYRAVRGGGLGAWVGFSAVACMTTLIEPVFLPGLLLSGLMVLFWPGLAERARVRNLAVLAITIFVIIGPWSVRNYIVHGKWVPIKNSFWVNVWKGNNDYATGTDRVALDEQTKQKIERGGTFAAEQIDVDRQYAMLDLSQQTRLKNEPEVVREKVFKEFALTWIKAHPQRYLQLCGIRLVKTLTVDWDNPKSYNKIYLVSRWALLAFSVVGLGVAARQRWSLLYVAALYGTALLSYTLTVTAARFSLPFEPIQLCLAAAVVALPLDRWQRAHEPSGFEVRATVRRQPPRTAPTAAPERASA